MSEPPESEWDLGEVDAGVRLFAVAAKRKAAAFHQAFPVQRHPMPDDRREWLRQHPLSEFFEES